jgi:hypothetical protein
MIGMGEWRPLRARWPVWLPGHGRICANGWAVSGQLAWIEEFGYSTDYGAFLSGFLMVWPRRARAGALPRQNLKPTVHRRRVHAG